MAVAAFLVSGKLSGIKTMVLAGILAYLWAGIGGLAQILLMSLLAIGLFFMTLRVKKHEGANRGAAGAAVAVAWLMLATPVVLIFFGVPLHLLNGCTTGCKSNLKNLSTALEMYSTDHGGAYPQSLEELTPQYLETVPRCLRYEVSGLGRKLYRAQGIEFAPYRYQPTLDPDPGENDFKISCQTGMHFTGPGFPYVGAVEGIVDSPDRY